MIHRAHAQFALISWLRQKLKKRVLIPAVTSFATIVFIHGEQRARIYVLCAKRNSIRSLSRIWATSLPNRYLTLMLMIRKTKALSKKKQKRQRKCTCVGSVKKKLKKKKLASNVKSAWNSINLSTATLMSRALNLRNWWTQIQMNMYAKISYWDAQNVTEYSTTAIQVYLPSGPNTIVHSV